MDENKLEFLINNHPLLFRGKGPEIESYVFRGWYPLLNDLCTQIENELTEGELREFQWVQIKQKFGELRLYFRSPRRDDVQMLVRRAEQASQTICQVCGSQGRMRDDEGYYAVLCDRHTPQRVKKY